MPGERETRKAALPRVILSYSEISSGESDYDPSLDNLDDEGSDESYYSDSASDEEEQPPQKKKKENGKAYAT
jgi:hypothetical protein